MRQAQYVLVALRPTGRGVTMGPQISIMYPAVKEMNTVKSRVEAGLIFIQAGARVRL